MLSDILLPVCLIVKTTGPKFPVISTVLIDFFGLFYYMISERFHPVSALSGLAVHTMPSAFGSHSFPSLVKFFGFDPGAAGLPCMSPSALAFVWVDLCLFGRATFIGWHPLKTPHWSLGVVRWHSGTLLVFLFLLLDLLNDLPDLPLCCLLERHRMKKQVLTKRQTDSVLRQTTTMKKWFWEIFISSISACYFE